MRRKLKPVDTPTRSARSKSSDAWANKIRIAWQKSVAAIFETGDLLLAAKKKLPRGQFESMVQQELPFSERTAERLMVIARCPWLRKASHGSLLPPSWRTLSEIARLKLHEFNKAVRDGVIHPEVQRYEIEAIITLRPMPTLKITHEPGVVAVPVYEDSSEESFAADQILHAAQHLGAVAEELKEPEDPAMAALEAACDALRDLANEEIVFDVLVKMIRADAKLLQQSRRAIRLILQLKALLDGGPRGTTPTLQVVKPADPAA